MLPGQRLSRQVVQPLHEGHVASVEALGVAPTAFVATLARSLGAAGRTNADSRTQAAINTSGKPTPRRWAGLMATSGAQGANSKAWAIQKLCRNHADVDGNLLVGVSAPLPLRD